MNKLALSGVALAIVGVAAAGVGGTACTVTSGTGDDGGITAVGDSGKEDTGTTSDSGGTGDDSGTTADTGTTQDSGGGDSGLACATTGDPTCDNCIQTNCATAFCGCAGDTQMVTDDAGSSPACLAYVNCVGSLSKGDPDAGIPPESIMQAETDCSGGDAGGTYPPSSVQTGNSLVACVAQGGPCAQACGNP